ncbi:unnamed protein product [Cuscuta campestris]|uniref:HAT C-terminal dimerisation domain-containing protein n=1 Tax=Cuscuta campestris TaxID=132261 RepID=A0A484LHR1_9ASTE|nr:unnamed protein product [Cuscuta campestris]
MLESASVYKAVFDRYKTQDADFRADFSPKGVHGDPGFPLNTDWVVVERSSLTPKMSQALICTQDWLRHSPICCVEEEEEFCQKLEKELVINHGVDTNILGL